MHLQLQSMDCLAADDPPLERAILQSLLATDIMEFILDEFKIG